MGVANSTIDWQEGPEAENLVVFRDRHAGVSNRPNWSHNPGEPVPAILAPYISLETWTSFLDGLVKSDESMTAAQKFVSRSIIPMIIVFILILVLPEFGSWLMFGAVIVWIVFFFGIFCSMNKAQAEMMTNMRRIATNFAEQFKPCTVEAVSKIVTEEGGRSRYVYFYMKIHAPPVAMTNNGQAVLNATLSPCVQAGQSVIVQSPVGAQVIIEVPAGAAPGWTI